MTKFELELISDADLYFFLEKGMIGRVSNVTERCSKAADKKNNRCSKKKNKYLKTYDPKQESKHIIYLDTNNVHGYVMCKFLPTGGFKRIASKKFVCFYC